MIEGKRFDNIPNIGIATTEQLKEFPNKSLPKILLIINVRISPLLALGEYFEGD